MPAKKQVEKKNVVASKNRKKKKPKGDVGTEEAPIIIKGSSQGPGGYLKGVKRGAQSRDIVCYKIHVSAGFHV